MVQKTSLLAFALFSFIHLLAQQADPIVFTIDGKPVYKSEVEKAYHGNGALSEGKKTIGEFITSFVDFKLNVEEAKAQGLDTTPNYRREYSSNKIQLTDGFLQKGKVQAEVVKMIYDRTRTDVEINHAFIAFDKDIILPSDTLVMYNKAMQLRNKLESKGFEGEGFVDYTTITSVVPDRYTRNGYMGWVTPFMLPMQVEDAVYSLPTSQISAPICTNKGYHIVQVLNKRPARGVVGVEQIMMSFENIPPTQQQKTELLRLMNVAHKKALTNGGWTALCEEYIESNKMGHKTCDFGVHAQDAQLPPSFLAAAFALKEIGDISEPVLTDYGYHLIRLTKKIAPAEFDEIEEPLLRMINFSERSEYTANKLYDRQSVEFNLSVSWQAYHKIKDVANKVQPMSSSFATQIDNADDILFKIDNKTTYQVKDFLAYIRNQTKTERTEDNPVVIENQQYATYTLSTDILNDYFRSYILAAISVYERETLDTRHPEFGAMLNTFTEGILLYDVKDKNIWRKKVNDSELLDYYEKNKNKYGKDKFNDIKTQIESDYRDQLEKDWSEYLLKKYTVKIDKSVLNTIK